MGLRDVKYNMKLSVMMQYDVHDDTTVQSEWSEILPSLTAKFTEAARVELTKPYTFNKELWESKNMILFRKWVHIIFPFLYKLLNIFKALDTNV
jgi:glutathionyl-hydroquinone reductase